ncbi:palmitoyltransferase swf1 [Collariella sp. IMI 366227]|nr:palmitoyltransferase swf1 [Collariella sp. IMI 366227]
MGALATIALIVLGISFMVFVTFFGRLPALRNTPIAWLHKILWVHLPNAIVALDQRISNGRITTSCTRFGNYILYDRHPTILIFFLTLLLGGEYLYLPSAWPQFTTLTKLTGTITILLPYLFLYLSAFSDPGYITPSNHASEMSRYPYDFTLFHPGAACSTCHLLKPARSKHCSVCKRFGGFRRVGVAMGAVTLLALMTSPLVWGLLGYHVWLIYCGTTTNESMKWSDFQVEMDEGFAFKRRLDIERAKDLRVEPAWTRWPVEAEQVLVRSADGRAPGENSGLPGVGAWEAVWRLRDVENLYDLGFWDNLLDVFIPGFLFRDPHVPAAESRLRRKTKRRARKIYLA